MTRLPSRDRHPWDPALGFRAPKLTDTQRKELREKYLAAREENPELSKTQFAMTAATEYNVSAGLIRHLLANL